MKNDNRGLKITIIGLIAGIIIIAAVLIVLTIVSGKNTNNKAKDDSQTVTIKTAESPDTSIQDDTPTNNDTESNDIRLSFTGVGDNIIYQAGFTDALNRAYEGGRKYNFKPIYTNIAQRIESADISYINQETLMAGEDYGYSDYPLFNCPQDLGYDIAEMGFDVVNIANNHMLDMGTQGLSDTIDFWRNMPVTLIGGYKNKNELYDIKIIERQGVRIAFLTFTYATNGMSVVDGSELYVPYIDDNDILTALNAACEVSDLQFVAMHWGDENNFTPNSEQRRVAQLLADNGTDVILGSHPHVIQPIEWLTGNEGKCLCIYSLGDLVAVMMKGYNMLGGMISFDIVRTDGVFTIENPIFTPLVCHFGPSYYNCVIYDLADFDENLSSTFGNVYGITDTKETLTDYVRNTINDEFLPDEIK